MKKTIMLATAAVSSVCAYAETTSADWTRTTSYANQTETYTTTLEGSFTLTLADAGIVLGDKSFSLSVTTTAPSFANSWGTGLIGTSDPYAKPESADKFWMYVGSTTNQKVQIGTNNWGYTMDNVVYTEPTDSAPWTFSFTLTYNADADTPYIEFSSNEGSSVTFDTKRDTNIVSTFNYATLTNVGQVAVPSGTTTTISITRGAVVVPEPATATLSLLALAGLAARRRRH